MKNEVIVNSIKFIGRQRSTISKRFSKFAMPEYTLFSVYAIITGACVGLAAVLFHEAIELLSHLCFEYGASKLAFIGGGIIIVFPILGMLLQSIMIKSSPVTAQKRGVAEVIKAVAMRGGFIRFRTTVFHFFAPIINLGTGGTLGPEGPAAQLGGGVSSKLGQLLGLSDSRRRMFTAAGSGAAIAAVFNTPLGGIFFALEVILLNDFQTATFSALILASVTASAISRIFLGNNPAFNFETVSFSSYDQLYLYAILGLAAGFLSLLFIRYSDALEKFLHTQVKHRIPQWTLMGLVGLLVGICGYFYHDVFGIGYEAINKVLAERISWDIVAIILILKFILVPIVLYSGGFGGIFAPSLFIGATFGYLFALAVNQVLGTEVNTTIFVLVGMGAVLGGINSIPISAILIIFEMTKDYSFILPLMLAVVISTTIVQLFMKKSVHVDHLEKQGYNIANGRQTGILKDIQVKEVMHEDALLIPEETTLSKLISQLLDSHHGTFYTVNREGKLSGVISESELRPIITEYEQVRDMLVAKDIASHNLITVSENDDLDYVLKLFGNHNVDELPVISVNDNGKVIGTIWRQDVISTYNRESLKYNLTDSLAHELKTVQTTHSSKVADGYSIVEKKVPASFIGKTLVDLKLRNERGLEVLMIKKRKSPFADESGDKIIMPDRNYKLQSDDTLVLFGGDDRIENTKDW